MSPLLKSFIVSPSELRSALDAQQPHGPGPRIIPLSAEWYLPNDPRKGSEEFTKLRIPGARFFDIDVVKDENSPYPHMLPTAETFASSLNELGIREEDTVVLYDSPHIGIFSAPRAAWTFKVFKHERVHLLNNFKLWVEQGFETENGKVERSWEAVANPHVKEADKSLVANFEDVVELARGKSNGVEILDARPAARWSGKAPEPRPEISSGHVPGSDEIPRRRRQTCVANYLTFVGSKSVPFVELLDPTTKAFKSPSELRQIFLNKGVDLSSKTEKVLMCGTGVTAVVVENALLLAGAEGHRKVYDGSWT